MTRFSRTGSFHFWMDYFNAEVCASSLLLLGEVSLSLQEGSLMLMSNERRYAESTLSGNYPYLRVMGFFSSPLHFSLYDEKGTGCR